jgi:hypothetical protein
MDVAVRCTLVAIRLVNVRKTWSLEPRNDELSVDRCGPPEGKGLDVLENELHPDDDRVKLRHER